MFMLIFVAEICGPVIAAAANGCDSIGGAAVIAATAAALAVSVGLMIFFKAVAEKSRIPFWIFAAGILVILAAVFLILRKIAINGGIIYVNGFLFNWNLRTGSVVYYSDFGNGSATLSLSLFLVLAVAVITLISELLIHYRRRIELLIFNFLIFAAATILLPGNAAWPSICAGLSMLAYGVYCGTDKEFFTGRNSIRVLLPAALVAVAAAVIVTVIPRFIPSDILEVPQGILMKSIEDIYYGKGDLPEGDLKNATAKPSSSASRLEVRVENEDGASDESHPIYLRGFVGSVYNGKGWEDLDDEVYRGMNLSMLQWLTQNNEDEPTQDFIPLSSAASALTLSNEYATENDLPLHDIYRYRYSVVNTGASGKYLYVPAGLTDLETGRDTEEVSDSEMVASVMNRDINIKNGFLNSATAYTAGSVELSMDDYIYLVDNDALASDDFRQKNEYFVLREQTYSDFVDECYNYLPDDNSERSFYEGDTIPSELVEYFDADSFLDRESSEGASDMVWDVREYLERNLAYTAHPASSFNTPAAASGDYVLNLLIKDHQGYSVQYATVATLVFRYLGIPARYVEGYMFNADNAANGRSAEINVTAANAHAWVEIYRYGFGWIPVDVTPGFYEIPEERQLIIRNNRGDNGGGGEEAEETEQETDEDEPDDPEEELERNLWWVIIIAVIAAIILFFILRNVIALSIRKKKIHDSDHAAGIRVMAGLIVKNASLAGVSLRRDLSHSESESMNSFMSKDPEYKGNVRFEDTAAAVAHAFYSSRGADRADADTVESCLNATVKALYAPAGFFKKLKLKYIDLVC